MSKVAFIVGLTNTDENNPSQMPIKTVREGSQLSITFRNSPMQVVLATVHIHGYSYCDNSDGLVYREDEPLLQRRTSSVRKRAKSVNVASDSLPLGGETLSLTW